METALTEAVRQAAREAGADFALNLNHYLRREPLVDMVDKRHGW